MVENWVEFMFGDYFVIRYELDVSVLDLKFEVGLKE